MRTVLQELERIDLSLRAQDPGLEDRGQLAVAQAALHLGKVYSKLF